MLSAVVLTACASTGPDYATCEDGNRDVVFTQAWVRHDTLRFEDPLVILESGSGIADCGVRVELGEPPETITSTAWPGNPQMVIDLHPTDTSRSGPLKVWYADRLVLDTTILLVRELPLDGEAYYGRRLTWEELQPVPSDIENAYLFNPSGADSILEVEVDSLGIRIPYHRSFDRGRLRAFSPSKNVAYTTDHLRIVPPPVSAERAGDVVSITLGNSEWQVNEEVVLYLDNNYPQGESYELPLSRNSASGVVAPGSYSAWCRSKDGGIYFEMGNVLVP